jgi:hypothetical protein
VVIIRVGLPKVPDKGMREIPEYSGAQKGFVKEISEGMDAGIA